MATLDSSILPLVKGKTGLRRSAAHGYLREICAVALMVVLAASLMARSAKPDCYPGQPDKKPPSLEDALHQFDLLSPSARRELLNKATKEDSEFHLASRGDVMTVVAQGLLQSVKNGDIYCKVRNSTKGGSTYATIIKSIIDNGSTVRKGDVLVILDDSGFQDQLKDKLRTYQRTLADKYTAQSALDLQKIQNQADKVASDIALRDAELNLTNYRGNDPAETEILKLAVETAQLSGQLVKTKAKLGLRKAEADLRAKLANSDAELALVHGVQEQIDQCTIKAPLDGRISYYVPAFSRTSGGSQHPVVAQGEPVREGQKLLQIHDLRTIQVLIRVPESSVVYLRNEDKDKNKWQSALIKVDAFPKTVLKAT